MQKADRRAACFSAFKLLLFQRTRNNSNYASIQWAARLSVREQLTPIPSLGWCFWELQYLSLLNLQKKGTFFSLWFLSWSFGILHKKASQVHCVLFPIFWFNYLRVHVILYYVYCIYVLIISSKAAFWCVFLPFYFIFCILFSSEMWIIWQSWIFFSPFAMLFFPKAWWVLKKKVHPCVYVIELLCVMHKGKIKNIKLHEMSTFSVFSRNCDIIGIAKLWSLQSLLTLVEIILIFYNQCVFLCSAIYL